jgi:hypothetical protein
MLAAQLGQSAIMSQTRTDIGPPQSGQAQASTSPLSQRSRLALPAGEPICELVELMVIQLAPRNS